MESRGSPVGARAGSLTSIFDDGSSMFELSGRRRRTDVVNPLSAERPLRGAEHRTSNLEVPPPLTPRSPSPACLHIRKPVAAALKFVGESLVVDAEQVQHRRGKIVNVNAVGHDVVADVSASPKPCPPSCRRRHPRGEAARMVIAPKFALIFPGSNSSAQTRRPTPRASLESPRIFKSLMSAAAGDPSSLPSPAARRQSAVMIPILMIEADETHALLREPPRLQTVRREGAGVLHIGPYESSVAADSCERSVTSGMLVCIRNAISYWSTRL